MYTAFYTQLENIPDAGLVWLESRDLPPDQSAVRPIVTSAVDYGHVKMAGMGGRIDRFLE